VAVGNLVDRCLYVCRTRRHVSYSVRMVNSMTVRPIVRAPVSISLEVMRKSSTKGDMFHGSSTTTYGDMASKILRRVLSYTIGFRECLRY
jgi:hypothetical protein